MILIGQYDSPFVRRVGIALVHLGIPFEHHPWSVFGDGDKIAPHNPLVRVPTLVLDSGEALIESAAMLDHLDSHAGQGRKLTPTTEPSRYRALRITTLAMGMAEKAVSLFYEKRLHDQVSDVWASRCTMQILGALATLEQDRADGGSPFWFGDRLMNADVAVAVAFRFINDAHPGLVDPASVPHISEFCQRMEDLDVFRQISQAFVPPA